MRRRSRLLRVAKWGGVVVCGTIFTEWCLSLFVGLTFVANVGSFSVARGAFSMNIFGGTALIFLLGGLVAGMGSLGQYFTVERRRSMGMMATGFTLLWIYFFWSQFFVTWYGNLPNEMAPIWAKMYGHYQPLFWIMMACVLFIPLGTLIFAVVKRRFWMLAAVAVVMLFGTWLNRYLMVMPALVEDHWQFSALSEIVIGAGLMAGFVFMLLVCYQAFPLISKWEMDLKEYRSDLADHPQLW